VNAEVDSDGDCQFIWDVDNAHGQRHEFTTPGESIEVTVNFAVCIKDN